MRRVGWLAACGLLFAGCPVGLDAPLVFTDATPATMADDASSHGDADDGPSDGGVASQPDAMRADADGSVMLGPPDLGDLDADAMTPPDAAAPDVGAPDGGVYPTEACDAIPAVTCSTPLTRAFVDPVRHVRVLSLGNDDALVAVVTSAELAVIRFENRTSTLLRSETLPAGAVPIDLAFATVDRRWILYVATSQGLLCRSAETDGTMPRDGVGAFTRLRAMDAEPWYGFEAVALDDSTSPRRLLRWSSENCDDVAGPTPFSVAPLPADVAIFGKGRDLTVAFTSTAAGAAFVRAAFGTMAVSVGSATPFTRPAARSGIDALYIDQTNIISALTTRTATAPDRALLELLFQSDTSAAVRRPTRIVQSDVRLADCGGDCVAAVYVPAVAPDRVEATFVTYNLSSRGRGNGAARVACTTQGPVSAVDVAGEGNSVAVAWSAGNDVYSTQCPRL